MPWWWSRWWWSDAFFTSGSSWWRGSGSLGIGYSRRGERESCSWRSTKKFYNKGNCRKGRWGNFCKKFQQTFGFLWWFESEISSQRLKQIDMQTNRWWKHPLIIWLVWPTIPVSAIPQDDHRSIVPIVYGPRPHWQNKLSTKQGIPSSSSSPLDSVSVDHDDHPQLFFRAIMMIIIRDEIFPSSSACFKFSYSSRRCDVPSTCVLEYLHHRILQPSSSSSCLSWIAGKEVMNLSWVNE